MSLFDRDFYDFIIRSFPEGPDSLSTLAQHAKKYGYSGVAILNSIPTDHDLDNKPDNFSIYSAIEISCKPSKIRDEIKKSKFRNCITLVRGGDEGLNRAAVESHGLDILLQPDQFNHIHAKFARENSITLGFDIGSIIRNRGSDRVRELAIMRTNLKYARKYELPMLLTSNSYSLYDIRAPREIAAMAGLFGMTKEEAVDSLSAVPLEILERKNPDYIQKGIEII